MPSRVLVLPMLVLLTCPLAIAQTPVLPPEVRAAADGIVADTLARDLRFLAADALLGRDTGSVGFDVAAAYITRRLESAGVAPLGDGGAFRQHYDLVEMHVDTTRAVLTVEGERFPFGDGFVLRSFAGPVDATARVVYVGHGWYAPDRGLDPYAGVDVRGKLVLAHGPRAMPRGVDIAHVGRVAAGASSVLAEASRRGALGVLFLTSSSPSDDWQAMRTAHLVRRELEPGVPSAYAAPPTTSVVLAAPALRAVMAGQVIDAAALLVRGEAGNYPPSFELTRPVTLRVPLASSSRTRPYNLVALVEGSDPVLKDEYLTVAAHLDGAVGTRAIDGDRIYNSADDNATGSAAILSIAEQLITGPRPRRSVIFIWDSGEERGLWGTRQFVHAPPVPLDRIVAHINVDMIGGTRAPGTSDAESPGVTGPNEVFLIGPGVLSPTVDALITRVNAQYLGMTLDRRDDRADSEFFYPRTDAGPFLERGILTIGFTTGTHARYHLPSDEARHLDPTKIEAVARTVYATLWTLADTADRPRIEREIPASVPPYGNAAPRAR